MNKKELQAMIQEIVRAEVKKRVEVFLPIVVKEVVADTVRETTRKLLRETLQDSQEVTTAPTTSEQPPLDKAKLRSRYNALMEGVETEEWPTLGGRTMTKEDIGMFGNRNAVNALRNPGTGKLNIVSSMPLDNESATEIPIDPSRVPPSVIAAMNKDYRSMMKKLDAATSKTRPV